MVGPSSLVLAAAEHDRKPLFDYNLSAYFAACLYNIIQTPPRPPARPPRRQALSIAERAGATYVMGDLIDRVAPEGVLAPIAPSPRLEQQFPLACHVVEKLYSGWDFKVVAFRVSAAHTLRG